MQTRKMSAVETGVSTAIGYTVATAANYYILPLFGHTVTWSAASWIGVIFTAISLVRGYLVRRMFNAFEKSSLHRLWKRDMRKWLAGDETILMSAANLQTWAHMYPEDRPKIDAEWRRRHPSRYP